MLEDHPDNLAGYEVVGVIGHGAKSTIYEVKDPESGDRYALKRVIKDDAKAVRFIEQVQTEHDVSQAVDHPNIRKCHEILKKRVLFSVAEVYLRMELVAGLNMTEKKPDSISEELRIFIIVAQALHAMHEEGYVHADMKPSNIILDDDEHVKVIDLGQSCEIGTAKKRIQGTADYIAPEQVKRRPLTPQTDMFNFGATMYWCLTNEFVPTLIPVEGEEKPRKLQVPSELRSEIPTSLSDLILQCVREHPSERPETMDDILATLRIARHQTQRAEKEAADATKQAEAKEPATKPDAG